jgi:hypothetical protein
LRRRSRRWSHNIHIHFDSNQVTVASIQLDLGAILGIDRAREFIKHGVVRVRIFVSQEGVLWIIHIGLALAARFEDQFFISFFVGVLIDQPNDSSSLTFVAALTLALEGITA